MSWCTSHRKKYEPTARAGTTWSFLPEETISPTETGVEALASVKIATLCGAASWLSKWIVTLVPALTSTVDVENFMSFATIVGPSATGPEGADAAGLAAAVEQAALRAAMATRERAIRVRFIGAGSTS